MFLSQKPILIISEKKNEASSVFLPTPPVDAAEVRKVSSAWKGLFRTTSPKDLFSGKVVSLDENKNVLIHIICWKNNCMMGFNVVHYMNY